MADSTEQSFRKAVRRMNEAARATDLPLAQFVNQTAEEVMTDVVASRPGAGVPRDMGDLASTRKVETGGSRERPHADLSFGGPAAPYALVQHERLDYAHTVGEARYLVRGLERWEPGQAERALRANLEAAWRNIEARS